MLQRRILLARVILACVAAIQQAMVSSALVCSASMDVIIRIEIYRTFSAHRTLSRKN